MANENTAIQAYVRVIPGRFGRKNMLGCIEIAPKNAANRKAVSIQVEDVPEYVVSKLENGKAHIYYPNTKNAQVRGLTAKEFRAKYVEDSTPEVSVPEVSVPGVRLTRKGTPDKRFKAASSIAIAPDVKQVTTSIKDVMEHRANEVARLMDAGYTREQARTMLNHLYA